MSSGIHLSVRSEHGVRLAEQEARCEVRDGLVEAVATWSSVAAGLYDIGRIRIGRWERDFTVDIEPVPGGENVTVRAFLRLEQETVSEPVVRVHAKP